MTEKEIRRRDEDMRSVLNSLDQIIRTVKALDNKNTDEYHAFHHALSGLNQAYRHIGTRRRENAQQLGMAILGVK